MNTQTLQELPSLIAIAESFRALTGQQYDPETGRLKSDVSEDDARHLKTAANETQEDAIAALRLISDLIAEYPTGTGNDESLLRQTGSAVRVLAEVLELTARTRELAAEAVDEYEDHETAELIVMAA
jgi:hypothetical protein